MKLEEIKAKLTQAITNSAQRAQENNRLSADKKPAMNRFSAFNSAGKVLEAHAFKGASPALLREAAP